MSIWPLYILEGELCFVGVDLVPIWSLIAMLQVSPWLMPSRTFPTVIQAQFGAKTGMTGSGSAVAQPVTRTGLRPYSRPTCRRRG